MPTYINPNQHPVNVTISDPRVSLTVWPSVWARARLPHDARQEVVLDEMLARELVRMGMLKLKPEPPVQTDLSALDDSHPMRSKEVAMDALAIGGGVLPPDKEPELLEPQDLPPAALPTPDEAAAIAQGDTEEILPPKKVAKAKPKTKMKSAPKPDPVARRRFFVPEE